MVTKKAPSRIQGLIKERDFALHKLEYKSGQAYQVIGYLLDKCEMLESDEGQRALDYFSDEHAHDDNFLPWPSFKSSGDSK